MTRALATVALCGLLAACAGRAVEVSTGPETVQQAAVSLRVTNSLAQAVNVYVVTDGNNGTGAVWRVVPT